MGSRGSKKRRLVPLYNPPSSQYKFSMAATMRNNPMPAEQAMWEILTKEVMPKFPEHKFKQQQVVLGYILDFYCETLRFGIEVDGGVHKDSKQYDRHRDNILARNGVHVLRIRNDIVFDKPQRLAFQICNSIKYKTSSRQKKI